MQPIASFIGEGVNTEVQLQAASALGNLVAEEYDVVQTLLTTDQLLLKLMRLCARPDLPENALLNFLVLLSNLIRNLPVDESVKLHVQELRALFTGVLQRSGDSRTIEESLICLIFVLRVQRVADFALDAETVAKLDAFLQHGKSSSRIIGARFLEVAVADESGAPFIALIATVRRFLFLAQKPALQIQTIILLRKKILARPLADCVMGQTPAQLQEFVDLITNGELQPRLREELLGLLTTTVLNCSLENQALLFETTIVASLFSGCLQNDLFKNFQKCCLQILFEMFQYLRLNNLDSESFIAQLESHNLITVLEDLQLSADTAIFEHAQRILLNFFESE